MGDRRAALRWLALGVLTCVACGTTTIPQAEQPAAAPPAFNLEEATIADLQARMKNGQDTARSLVEKYTARIDQLDRQGPALRSVIELNPDALDDRRSSSTPSAKRRAPAVRCTAFPILIKDNIATADRMMTTAGSLALEGVRAPQDAFLVSRLRDAGAVILGKTNLSEWANFRSTHSTSGWSARGGQTRNPYALDRNPCGSSSGSGSAVAANLAAAAIGTETDGSIVSPAHSHVARRHQADARARQPHRHRADRPQPGHRRSDGANGRRRRGAPRARWTDRTPPMPRPPKPRSMPRATTPPRSIRRASRRADRRRPRQAVRLQPRGRSAGGSGDRRHEEGRARSSSTRRTSRRSARSTRASSTCCSTSSRPT